MAQSNVAELARYLQRADKTLPWNVTSPEQLGPCVMEHVNSHEPYFRRWAEIWFENYQFVYGNHNAKWSRRHGFAVDYDQLRQAAPSGQRAWTNLARVVFEALFAMLYSSPPEWEAEAMDDSTVKGKRFRRIAQRILEALVVRLCTDKDFAAAAGIYVLWGQFATCVRQRRNAGRILELPKIRQGLAPIFSTYMAPNQATGGLIEVPTQIEDELGKPAFEERWEAELDSAGRRIIDRVFAGDVGIDIKTPLEYRRAPGSAGMHKTPWAQDYAIMDFDQFMDEVRGQEGATRYIGRVVPLSSSPSAYEFAVRLHMRLAFTAPPSNDDRFRREGATYDAKSFRNKVIVVNHYDPPHPTKWKEGRRLIVANGVCTHITKHDYFTNKADGWHPYSEGQWVNLPPNSVAPGPMNDVIRKNRELNIKDSLIATAVRRNMGSQLLVKTGSGIDPQKLTGEPGLAHEVSDPYAARWLHDDMPIPPVISRLREIDKEDVYETSGALDAMRGQPSTGSTSGYQEKQRQEREERRLAPARKTFETTIGSTGEKALSCLRYNAKQLDQYTMGYLKRTAAGEFTTQDIIAFMNTPLDFGVDIKVVKSSMALKSRATMQATMQELANGPLKDRLSKDAKVLDEYLKAFDIPTLRDRSGPHYDRAQREDEVYNDMLRLGFDIKGIQRPLVLFEDDDDIHMAEHADDLVRNFDEYRNNEVVLLEKITHIEAHRIQRQEKQGELAPGSSLQTANMEAAARQVAKPTVSTIYLDQQNRQAQKAEENAKKDAQAKPAQPGAPQAPRLGKTAPGQPGAKPVDASAPSAATPPAAQGGAPQ